MPERRVDAIPRRRRDAAATREAILAAATRRFAAQGYERAGAREIAADAGVTAALVNRYFGSKEGLFAEVIARALDMGGLLRDGRADLAEHLARVVVEGGEDPPDGVLTALLLLLRSAADPRAIELFRRDRDQLRLLAERIGGDDAAVRAALVLAHLTGFAILRHVLRPEALANARGEELVVRELPPGRATEVRAGRVAMVATARGRQRTPWCVNRAPGCGRWGRTFRRPP